VSGNGDQVRWAIRTATDRGVDANRVAQCRPGDDLGGAQVFTHHLHDPPAGEVGCLSAGVLGRRNGGGPRQGHAHRLGQAIHGQRGPHHVTVARTGCRCSQQFQKVVLTKRISDAMRRAWEATEVTPLTAADVRWQSVSVQLPVAPHLNTDTLRATLQDTQVSEAERLSAAGKLAFVLRRQAGQPIDLSCLRLGNAYVLHMPGELFVEYQLAAQAMKPDATVCMAAMAITGPVISARKSPTGKAAIKPNLVRPTWRRR